MRTIILGIAVMMAAPISAQTSFETREDCLRELQSALGSADLATRSPERYARHLSSAPSAAAEHVAAALDAKERQAQADIDYANAVLLICQSYSQ